MTTNTIVKVAPRGEGKTKYLLNVAKEFLDKDITVYLMCKTENEFSIFCEKYFNCFNSVCLVRRLNINNMTISSEDVVLVDDLLTHDLSLIDIQSIQKMCKQMVITIDGIPSSNTQLTIYDI